MLEKQDSQPLTVESPILKVILLYINHMKSVIIVDMNIQITDLSRKITEDELIKLFTAYGTVSSTTIVMDKVTGKSKGFGFVEMADEKEALLAIEKLNKTKVGGQRIRVKKAK